MTLGRTLKIYLADREPTGIRYAEIVGWTGQALVVPRVRIASLNEWRGECDRPAVYILFADHADGDMPRAYIGETEDAFVRLNQHYTNREFQFAVAFTNKDENLTKAHVKYLERALVDRALAAARYTIENENTPARTRLPRPDRDAMEEFIENVELILGALGYPILVPLRRAAPSATDAEETSEAATLSFEVPNQRGRARGVPTDEGFVVLSGSVVAPDVRELNRGYVSLRARLVDDGVIAPAADGTLVFTRDQLFSSGSSAASVIVGYNKNGREAWRDPTGRTLGAIEAELSARETA